MNNTPIPAKTRGLIRYPGSRFSKKAPINPWASRKFRKPPNARTPRKAKAPKKRFAMGQALKFNTKLWESKRKIRDPV
jgi:hypothetical protein